MLTDLFFFLIGILLKTVVLVLSLITFPIPEAFTTAITEYVSYLSYAQGILPLLPNPSATGLWQSVGMLTLLGYGLQFIVVWYLLKLVLWAFSLIPWVGRHIHLPHGGSTHTAHPDNKK